MIHSQPQAACDHASTPPSGGGPGSLIERVVRRDATLDMTCEVADLVLVKLSGWRTLVYDGRAIMFDPGCRSTARSPVEDLRDE
jgi:hypothetical protein